MAFYIHVKQKKIIKKVKLLLMQVVQQRQMAYPTLF